MEITYSSTPETRKPWKTILIITVITMGAVFIYSQYIKMTENEEDSNIR